MPLDKAGKGPTKCANKRPIAPLSHLVKLVGLVLVGRIMPHVHLDRFVSGNIQAQKTTHVVGLDVAGAFDSAFLVKLVETLLRYGVTVAISRLIGSWLAGRFFKIKLRTPLGAVFSDDYTPTRGCPRAVRPLRCYGYCM